MQSTKIYKKIIAYLVLLLIFNIVATILYGTVGISNLNERLIQEDKTVNTNGKSPNDWTFLVYLDADNNLEAAGISDFLEMSSVGSDANISIVVQFDRISGYDTSYDDWTTTKRFYITPGMTPNAASALLDLGEQNMGLSSTLSNFITWGTTNWPSDHYALVLWNHGDGWKSQEEKNDPLFKGVCYDNTDVDYLTIQEVETALSTADVYIDLLGFDACLMANVEVDYQLKDLAQVRVSSEEVIPLEGWPYDTILSDLTSTPTMSPNSLGTIIVNRYIEYYGTNDIETLSAVDLLQENTLSTAIESLALELTSKIGTYLTDIRAARWASDASYFDPTFIDLYNFSYQLYNRISDTAIQNAAQNIMNAINSMMIAEAHGLNHPGFHGITIYYPVIIGNYDSSYETILDFTNDLSWDDFLLTYYANLPDDNYEENDDDTEAYDLSSYEDTWLSTINGSGIQADDDWYEIYVTPGYERLRVELTFTHSEGDIDIDVYDASISLITYSESVTDNEYINYIVPSSGTYYLLIYYGDAGNEYDLWWNDTSPVAPTDDNYEENDYYYEAYDLSSYEGVWLSTIDGLGIQADDDWYQIYITSGNEHLRVELTFTHSEGDIDITVYDNSLSFITASWSSTDNEYIDYILPSSGTYYLLIFFADAGNEYDLWWNDTSPVAPTDDNYEENDYYYEAYDLSSYEGVWLSTIDGLGIQADDDWYQIYITSGNEHLRVELTFTHSEGDIDITVYDNSLSFITASWSSTDNEYINTIVPSSGIYYLLIDWGDAGNEYDLKWSSQPPGGGSPGIPGYNVLILFGSIFAISIIIIKKVNKK
ncbi:MAG: clostripain-related cysteine peptidase [Promethearchaeota archaeon]